MTKPRIFITQPIAESALRKLREVMEVEIHPDPSKPIGKNDLIKGVARNDYLFIRLSDAVDGEVMGANLGLHQRIRQILERAAQTLAAAGYIP